MEASICKDTLKDLQPGMFRMGKWAFLCCRTKDVKKVCGVPFYMMSYGKEGSLQLCLARAAQGA